MAEKTEKRIKVLLTPAGSEWVADKEYKRLDYISDGKSVWVCVKVDAVSGVNVGHPLTDTDWWHKSIDLSEAVANAEKATERANQAAATTEGIVENVDARVGEAVDRANASADNADAATLQTQTAIADAQAATTAANNAAASVDESKEQAAQASATALESAFTADTAAANCDKATEESKKQVAIAEEFNTHPQKQGDNGNWWSWDAEKKEYVDTGIVARGGTLYPKFHHEGNKLYADDFDSSLQERVMKEGNKLVFAL